MTKETYPYSIEKYRRNHNFEENDINIDTIISSARDECIARVIGKMTIGKTFNIGKTSVSKTQLIT